MIGWGRDQVKYRSGTETLGVKGREVGTEGERKEEKRTKEKKKKTKS